MDYNPATKQAIEDMTAILGRESISVKESDIAGCSCDEMPMCRPYPPQVIVKPANAKEVSSLLKYANKHRIAVTPRGAGTGLSGGCIPIHGGVVLSLERMNRILEIDTANFVAVVEPGVVLSD